MHRHHVSLVKSFLKTLVRYWESNPSSSNKLSDFVQDWNLAQTGKSVGKNESTNAQTLQAVPGEQPHANVRRFVCQ